MTHERQLFEVLRTLLKKAGHESVILSDTESEWLRVMFHDQRMAIRVKPLPPTYAPAFPARVADRDDRELKGKADV
jgi:hypothetical protein